MQSVKFKKPPLIEVVFGMNIEIPGISLVHFGLYWETIKEKFPTPVESFGELTLVESSSYESSFPTVWYLSSEENRLIRLTEDYFSFHCRCINEEYQHFENLFKEFINEWKNLESWWSNISKENIKADEFSLQYINLIDEKSNWKSLEDNSKIFNFFPEEIKTSLGSPNIYSSEFRFDLPDNYGNLIVSLEQRKLKESKEELKDIMIFTLSAISSDVEINFQENWFSFAHDSIIQSFLDLTTKEAQSQWDRHYE